MFTQIIWTVVFIQNIVFQHPGLSMMWYLKEGNSKCNALPLWFSSSFYHNYLSWKAVLARSTKNFDIWRLTLMGQISQISPKCNFGNCIFFRGSLFSIYCPLLYRAGREKEQIKLFWRHFQLSDCVDSFQFYVLYPLFITWSIIVICYMDM